MGHRPGRLAHRPSSLCPSTTGTIGTAVRCAPSGWRDASEISKGRLGSDLRDLATRLSGSADIFSYGELPGGRGPLGSVNFVTAHDGFTLRDLVSYDYKHNLANGEDNRDGHNDNHSWNAGAEGPY